MIEWFEAYWPCIALNTVAFVILVIGHSKERGVSPLSVYFAVLIMILAQEIYTQIKAGQ